MAYQGETKHPFMTNAEFDTLVPVVGSVWEHASGRLYTVIVIANEPNEERYPLIVVYEGADRRKWARPLNDWHRSMRLMASPKQEVTSDGESSTAPETDGA